MVNTHVKNTQLSLSSRFSSSHSQSCNRTRRVSLLGIMDSCLRNCWLITPTMIFIFMLCSYALFRSSLSPSFLSKLIGKKDYGSQPTKIIFSNNERAAVWVDDGASGNSSEKVPDQSFGNEKKVFENVLIEPTRIIQSEIPFPFDPTTGFNMHEAAIEWDDKVGCKKFYKKHKALIKAYDRDGWVNSSSFQYPFRNCSDQRSHYITIGIGATTWIPPWLQTTYNCDCNLACKIDRLENLPPASPPDAILQEGPGNEPYQRRVDFEPLNIFVDLEPDREGGYNLENDNVDIWVGFGADSDVQATYFGELFTMHRNRMISAVKREDIPLYWASSRCLDWRDKKAGSILKRVKGHSFGACANNVKGLKETLLYPDCRLFEKEQETFAHHSHCVISHYKFALGIENTVKKGYVTEKVYNALTVGTVPVYFGGPDTHEFLPPDSYIDGNKYSVSKLAKLIRKLNKNPVAYMDYHAWRRCGFLGHYKRALRLSLDTLPCRLCQKVVDKLQNQNR